MLVNTLIVNTAEVNDRRKIRNTYMPADLYQIFKDDELDEDIKEQLGIFDEEKTNDDSAGGEDLQALGKSLLDQLRGSAIEADATAIFNDLISLGTKR